MYEEDDCCSNCGWYWDMRCNCDYSQHYRKYRGETDFCGEYMTRKTWNYNHYGKWELEE